MNTTMIRATVFHLSFAGLILTTGCYQQPLIFFSDFEYQLDGGIRPPDEVQHAEIHRLGDGTFELSLTVMDANQSIQELPTRSLTDDEVLRMLWTFQTATFVEALDVPPPSPACMGIVVPRSDFFIWDGFEVIATPCPSPGLYTTLASTSQDAILELLESFHVEDDE